MRIVVAGGTGFIGREVVERLLETRGDEIVVTSRDPERGDPFGGRVRMVQAFAGDPISMGKAFTGAEVVVQAIQFPNHPVEDPSRGRTYMEVDGKGTEVAVAVAKKLGVRRFVYLSGAGAGQGRTQPWFQAKDRAEAAIRASGMEHALLRPSWIYGPGDRSMNRFVFFCRYLPVVPVIGDGKTAVQPICRPGRGPLRGGGGAPRGREGQGLRARRARAPDHGRDHPHGAEGPGQAAPAPAPSRRRS